MTRTLLVLFSGVMLAGCQAIATVVGGGIGPVAVSYTHLTLPTNREV